MTSNKQLNILQHIKTLVKINSRAAKVVPDSRALRGRCRRDGEAKAARKNAMSTRC